MKGIIPLSGTEDEGCSVLEVWGAILSDIKLDSWKLYTKLTKTEATWQWMMLYGVGCYWMVLVVVGLLFGAVG